MASALASSSNHKIEVSTLSFSGTSDDISLDDFEVTQSWLMI